LKANPGCSVVLLTQDKALENSASDEGIHAFGNVGDFLKFKQKVMPPRIDTHFEKTQAITTAWKNLPPVIFQSQANS
jgi:hypothetical protein